MGHPWGISGPGFIWLYILGMVVFGLLTLGLRRRLRTAGAKATAGQSLTTDELAVLAGGRPRLIESTLAGLIERGAVRVERQGKLHPTTGVEYAPQSDLEKQLLTRLRKRPGTMLYVLQRQITKHASFDAVRKTLAARGLYFPGGHYHKVFLAALPLYALAVIGIVRLIVGIQGHYPVGFLVALLVVTGLLIGFAMQRFKPGPTVAGMRVLSGRSTTTIPTVDAAARVAFGGMSSFPDATVASVFRLRPAGRPGRGARPRRTHAGYFVLSSGSSCSSYSSSSSCSSTSSSCSSSSSSTCSTSSSSSCGSSGSSCGGGGGCGGGSS